MPHNGFVSEKNEERPVTLEAGASPASLQSSKTPDELEFLDHVTGLPNDLRLENDITRDRSGKWLLVLDIGGLRKVNAIYGRRNGNILLTLVRDYILKANIPDSTLYRIAVGDFGILFRGDVDKGSVRKAAQKLFDRFDGEWIISTGGWRQSVIVTANICAIPMDGLQSVPEGGMYAAIEHTLDIARSTGCISFYGEHVEESYQHKMSLERGLKSAMDQGMAGFYPVYQPIVESGVALWGCMEALCRWDSPDFGIVPPHEFIPIAEACGLIGKIGMWLLEQAIIQVKRWELDRADGFLLHINLSPFQLKIPDLEQSIIALLNQFDYPPEKLCLEVTEAGSLNFQEHDMEALKKLSDIGVVIALDDFGSGFTSLGVLHKLPVRIIKIDKSFLDCVESDEKLRHLFNAIIELSHNSKIKVVVEGVETGSQARLLLEQNVDYFQGYLFSRPLSAEQMERELDNFRVPSDTLASIEYDRIDVLLPGSINKYELNPMLYKVLYECTRELFFQPDCDAAIEMALGYVGQSIGVSRSYVFLKDGDSAYSNTHEWCAPGVEPEKEHLQRIPVSNKYYSWVDRLKTDGIFLASDIRSLPPSIAEVLERQKIKSLLVFPLWKEKELYGFVGFDDCANRRRWSPEEVQALHTLTGIITSAMAKVWLQQEVVDESARREIILDSLDTAIHVTDINTHEILFANEGLIRMYGNQPIIGRKCWEVLENREGPCDFCPIGNLTSSPGRMYQWDHYCEAIKRHLRVRGGIISWTGGKLAHLEYADDVTELRNSQNQLKILASTDMLTRAMNRQSFIESAEEILSAALINGMPITLAFIDINGLKEVNDKYGHAEGDELILSVVGALRRNIRENDMLCRFGGDEFLILFSNCGKDNAAKSMRRALKKLKAISLEKNREYSFSYGFAENTEMPFVEPSEHLDKMIELADARMFTQKKKKKKKRKK